MRTLAFRIHMHIILTLYSKIFGGVLFFVFLSLSRKFYGKVLFAKPFSSIFSFSLSLSLSLIFATNPVLLTTLASSWVLIFMLCFILLAFVQPNSLQWHIFFCVQIKRKRNFEQFAVKRIGKIYTLSSQIYRNPDVFSVDLSNLIAKQWNCPKIKCAQKKMPIPKMRYTFIVATLRLYVVAAFCCRIS